MENEKSSMTERRTLSLRAVSLFRFPSRPRAWVEISACVALFIYYWVVVHPEYIQFTRQPAFFIEKNFFFEHLQMPGGILDYTAAFLVDSFQFGMLGAAVLTILVAIFYYLQKGISRPKVWWIGPLIPTIILAAVQTDPNYSLVQTLALIVSSAAFLLYRRTMPVRKWIRLGWITFMAIVVYLLSPYALMIFTLLSILYEMFRTDERPAIRAMLTSAYIIAAVLITLIAHAKAYLISTPDAFLRHSPLWVSDVSGVPPFGKVYLEILLGLSVLVSAGIFFFGTDHQKQPRSSWRLALIQGLIALVIVVVSFWEVVGGSERDFLAIRYAAHAGKWDQTLSYVNSKSAANPVSIFHLVRAYYQTGRINEEFTWLRQNVTAPNIFLKDNLGYEYPLDNSDFLYELGNINESKRWALEALTHYGESEDVLKRLALTHLLEGNFAAAREILSRLRENPFSSSWADHYLACVADPSMLREDGELQYLHACMPKSDFSINEGHPEYDLRIMLNQFPRNGMAYRYLLLHDLLSRNVNLFTNDFLQYRMNEQGSVPRLYEEALLVFLSSSPSMDSIAANIGIHKETVDSFKGFYNLISQRHKDLSSAFAEVRRDYGDTYWFYLLRIVPNN